LIFNFVGGHESLPSWRHESLPPAAFLELEAMVAIYHRFQFFSSFRGFLIISGGLFRLLFYISGKKKAGVSPLFGIQG
jgi:hypothetical protein